MSEIENIKWKTEETIRSGLGIHELAVTYREALEPRVTAAIIDGLRADLDELRSDAAGAVSSQAVRKAATLDQGTALQFGSAMVSAMRAAIRQVHPLDKALQRDFGVGMPVFVKSVPAVVGSLRTVLDAAEQHPDATRAAGIIEDDVRKAQDALASLTSADVTQESRKLGAREATARRRATQLRVQKGIGKIVGAACLAFLDKPDVVAKFTSLIPSRTRRSRKPAPSPEMPTATPLPS